MDVLTQQLVEGRNINKVECKSPLLAKVNRLEQKQSSRESVPSYCSENSECEECQR